MTVVVVVAAAAGLAAAVESEPVRVPAVVILQLAFEPNIDAVGTVETERETLHGLLLAVGQQAIVQRQRQQRRRPPPQQPIQEADHVFAVVVEVAAAVELVAEAAELVTAGVVVLEVEVGDQVGRVEKTLEYHFDQR